MSLDPTLLEILVCPKCRGEMEYRPEEQELRCSTCRLIFRIDDDIPILLIDEAEPF